MYRLFKDCLLFPKKIYTHLEKKATFYIIILFVLFSLPSIIAVLTNTSVSESLVDEIIDDVTNMDDIHYEIVDGKLSSTISLDNGQYFGSTYLSSLISVPVYVGFDPMFKLKVNIPENSLFIIFREQTVELWIVAKASGTSIPSDDKIVLAIHNTQPAKCITQKTYQELDLQKFDFSAFRESSIVENERAYTSLINKLINAYREVIYLITIPVVITSETIILLISVLLMAVIAFLLFKASGIRFKTIIKACFLCATPMIIINFIHLVVNSSFIDFIGELIMVVYLMITLNFLIRINIFKSQLSDINNESNKED